MRGCDVALLGLIEVGLACSGRANSNTLPPELQVLGAPSQTLDVKFPLSSPPYAVNVQPGGTLQASDTVDAPEADVGPLSKHGSNLFVFMMVDPDINTTHPTYVGLHTMVANLTPYNENGAASHSSHPFTTVATYIAPEPPAGEFHDYTLLAFHQPPHFSIPAKYASYVATTPTSPLNRINFPLQQFIADTNLGPVVAANWFKEGSA
ncbi:phosphatidylethanolamine-binding protein [Talaromyces proteolyticus]|uniref:Phosphatidylethanolamine-binding protein n=1 Tax=Talaromyces proteolyticus TaxID=1131652 RepID=A0AAD4L5X0_9EURO|nr:phosphatidylethanolamine-binding protein [Talaromyces proteolyticus]KAH8705691.1 phosphatidylethanolamine-binding protein [Talaromyces proteolyticus]